MSAPKDLPTLRGSERKDFKRCPTRWDWRWRQGLVQRSPKLGALWFGTGIHLALEQWYVPGTTRGRDPRETWEEFVGDRMVIVKAEAVSGDAPEGMVEVAMEAGELGTAMLTNYLDTYGQDEAWEIISPEEKFQVLVPRPGTKDPVIRFVGTYDIVGRDLETGHIWIWDHKTAKSIRTNHLPLDDQAGGYFSVADHVLRRKGILRKREVLKGIMYNFLLKAPPDERPRNAAGQATNKPVKDDYVMAVYLDELAKTGVEQPSDEYRDKLLAQWRKLTLPALTETAENRGLTVLGEVSKAQPVPRFRRVTVNRTAAERRTQIERIGSEAIVMDMFRTGQLPLYKTPTRDCSWDCDFATLCEIHEQQGDWETYIKEVYVEEDPYAAHEEKVVEE